LNCSVVPWCRFARKNYFYPDMPKDYQVSQYDEPICVDGYLDVSVPTEDGTRIVRVGIERVHMEEDTGKLTHAGGVTGRIHGADYSLVDYNRAGVPLIEIVTKPVTGTGELAPVVAKAYVAELRELVRSLGVSDVRMEEGSLRCDANLSIAAAGEPWGTRTETKNVNSLRSVERAIRYEVRRQAAVLDTGGRIVQETRHFHEDDGTTTPGRSKEQAEDYRYFPEPDLVPVAPDPDWVARLRSELQEPPAERGNGCGRLGISSSACPRSSMPGRWIWWSRRSRRVATTPEPGSGGWVNSRRGERAGVALAELPVTPVDVARVEELIATGALNDKLARQVLSGVLAGEGGPDAVVSNRGLAVLQDEGALIAEIDEVIAAQPEIVAKIRAGKSAAAGALIGSVMKATRGKADAARVRELLLERIGD
jgi:aspartyl-tRNA(Asn)/glutamyl-tRNA(Gln) amidotransferase subunit B